MNFIRLLLLPALVFTSCNRGTHERYIIQNDSDYEITVLVDLADDNLNENTVLVIASQKEKEFLTRKITPGTRGYVVASNYLGIFDNISVTINDSLKLFKDIYHMENWKMTETKGLLGPTEEKLVFTVNNSDLIMKKKNTANKTINR